MTRFSLPEPVKSLIDLLLKHNRSHLIAKVFQDIITFYYQRNTIQQMHILSTIPLGEGQKEAIKVFLAKAIPGTILYTYEVDKNLIAGLKMQSDTWLWEHSIDQQLHRIEKMTR